MRFTLAVVLLMTAMADPLCSTVTPSLSSLRNAASTTCTSSASAASDALIEANAWRFAPELRLHHLDDTSLQSVNHWLSDGATLFTAASGRGVKATREAIASAIVQGVTSKKGFLSRIFQNLTLNFDERRILFAGGGYDSQGRSRAPIYFNWYRSNRSTVIYNYHYFLPWNGCRFVLIDLHMQLIHA